MIKKRSKLIFTSNLFGGCAALLLSLGLPQTAVAQDDVTGLYVNVGAAFLSSDFEVDDIAVPTTPVVAGVNIPATTFEFDDVSANAFVINGRVGYRLHKYFALEVDGGIGVSGDSASQDLVVPVDAGLLGTLNVDTVVDVEADLNSYVVGFARLIYPVSDQVDIFVRGGYGTASFDLDGSVTASVAGAGSFTTDIDSQSLREDGFVGGVGAEYKFNRNSGIRLDFSAFTGDVDALFFAASYSYRF